MLKIICTLLFSFGFLITSLSAQTISTRATLSGQVVDPSAATVRSAVARVISEEQGNVLEQPCDAFGRFRFAGLPVGRYILEVVAPGFKNVRREGIKLDIHQTLDLLIRMEVGEVATSVVVASEAPVLDPVRSAVASLVEQKQVDELPLNGRNFISLALLVPGVSVTNTGADERFAETSAVPGTGISIAGQRNVSNMIQIDGVGNNDDAAGLPNSFFSQEVIREFQVVTSGAGAEFGRGAAGYINILTRSGTNDLHGTVYGYLRHQRLDARSPLSTRKDPFTQGQYGASLGGPLKKDRTFLFGNYERANQHRSGYITIAPLNVPRINAELDRLRFPGARMETGAFPTGYTTHNVFAKLDHHLSDRTHLVARYSLYDLDSPNGRNAGGLSAVSRATALVNRDQAWTASLTSNLSARWINDLRGQFVRSRFSAPPNDRIGPAVNIAGVANFGVATFSPTARRLDIYEAANTTSYQSRNHFVRFGSILTRNRLNIAFPGALQGVYSFSTLDNFLSGRYSNLQQAFGQADQAQNNVGLGLFVQDEWKATPSLTLQAGLRYDLETLPDPIPTGKKNFGPRVGFAYNIGSAHQWVVRGSYGIYYDRILLRATSNALQRDGQKYRVAILAPEETGAPVFPNVLSSFPTGVLVNINAFDPSLRLPYTQQASLEVQTVLWKETTLTLGYLYAHGLHLSRSRNLNVPRYSAGEAARLGIPNLGRPNPNYANISNLENTGNSVYHGMTLSLQKRFSAGLQYQLSYTLSKAIDDVNNQFFSTPQDNFNLRAERGLSPNDQRHRLTVSGINQVPEGSRLGRWALLRGWQLNYIFTYDSPQPFNLQAGVDLNNDTNLNDRPPFVGRNTGRGFSYASFDVRLGRQFSLGDRLKLSAFLEGFNLFNRFNKRFPNPFFGLGPLPRPGFGQPTGAGDPRQIQIGLRASF